MRGVAWYVLLGVFVAVVAIVTLVLTLALGAYELDLPGVPSVRRDVDTPGDLRAVLDLGTGPRTTAIVIPLLTVPESS